MIPLFLGMALLAGMIGGALAAVGRTPGSAVAVSIVASVALAVVCLITTGLSLKYGRRDQAYLVAWLHRILT
jgi:hypothetical protein